MSRPIPFLNMFKIHFGKDLMLPRNNKTGVTPKDACDVMGRPTGTAEHLGMIYSLRT